MKIIEIPDKELKMALVSFTCIVEMPVSLEDLSYDATKLNIGRKNILREMDRRERLGIRIPMPKV